MSGHHAYQMYAHVTWHSWKRVGCVDAAAASDVQSAVATACRATGVRVFRNAVLADHVHLVVSFRPDIRLRIPARRWPGTRLLQRSEEHTSELQSLAYLVCRLLLEKK